MDIITIKNKPVHVLPTCLYITWADNTSTHVEITENSPRGFPVFTKDNIKHEIYFALLSRSIGVHIIMNL